MHLKKSRTALLAVLSIGALNFTSVAARAEAWGSISIDFQDAMADPYYGVGGGATKDEAIGNAQKFCKEAGGKNCKTAVSYKQCGAYASSPKNGGIGWSDTKKAAEAQAITGCKDNACKIVISDCN